MGAELAEMDQFQGQSQSQTAGRATDAAACGRGATGNTSSEKKSIPPRDQTTASQSKRGSGSDNDFAPDPPESLIPEPRGEISTADGSRNLLSNLRGSDREALPFLLLWREKRKSSITALRLWRRQGRRRCCGCGDAVGGGRGFFWRTKARTE